MSTARSNILQSAAGGSKSVPVDTVVTDTQCRYTIRVEGTGALTDPFTIGATFFR